MTMFKAVYNIYWEEVHRFQISEKFNWTGLFRYSFRLFYDLDVFTFQKDPLDLYSNFRMTNDVPGFQFVIL
jgi:hypothetical protein